MNYLKMLMSRTNGWFTSVYPILVRFEDIKDINELSSVIKSVKEYLRGIPNKGFRYGILNNYQMNFPTKMNP